MTGPAWHTLTVQEICSRLGVEIGSGLSAEEANRRLAQFGPNRLHEEKQESFWEVFLEEIREPMILLLLVTGVLYAVWGEWVDTLTIFAVILMVVGIEVFNEYRAERAIAALRKLAGSMVLARRDRQYQEIPTERIVPGDVILLQAGQYIPADARVVKAFGLAVDESSLTGESVPVEKEAEGILAADTPLAERRNLVYAGTRILRGRGIGIVVSTGMTTELGRIAGWTRKIKPPRTPLQQTMRELARWMVWLALGLSSLIPLLGWLWGGQSPRQMLLTGLSLAFATIPEELPVLITTMLALGAYRLSRRKAIVKRLKAAETLGAVSVIATDKTGTLTENRMTVTRWYPEIFRQKLLKMGVLCNSLAGQDGWKVESQDRESWISGRGDPLELALLRAAQESGLDRDKLLQTYTLREEFAFDNFRKMMSLVYERDNVLWIVVKGSPEAILRHSTRQWLNGEEPFTEADRQRILAITSQMAKEGLRVIAFAEKTVPKEEWGNGKVESDLTFVGLVGLTDPPRPEVKEAIQICQAAGIRLIMITGDHPLTAQAIADQIGLNTKNSQPGGVGSERQVARSELPGIRFPSPILTGLELEALSDEALKEIIEEVPIYARITPEHKLRIVRALREKEEVVAVTGDGINDAPALAAADIGVAMGKSGSDIAREAADVILVDDNFATLVQAIKEGRLLFANLRKAIRYYLACKVALILATLLPVFLKMPVPFSPIQIILLELFMDLGASTTFVVERAESDLMHFPPRNPKARFMDPDMVKSILGSAMGLFGAVFLTYLVTWLNGQELIKTQTIAFVTWLLGHVLLAWNLRTEREPLFSFGLFSNPILTVWGLTTAIFIWIITRVPYLQEAFKTVTLSGQEWALAVSMAIIGTFWIEISKRWKTRSNTL